MPASDVLKSFRGSYDSEKPEESDEESSGGMRTIDLTDEEVKELQAYSKGEGQEQECLVTGRMGEDGEFTVVSVRNPDGKMPDQDQMASEVMGKMGQPPMMQPQTLPSPS